MSRDTFGGFAKKSQSLNRYAYVKSNPVSRTDPSGRASPEDFLAEVSDFAGEFASYVAALNQDDPNAVLIDDPETFLQGLCSGSAYASNNGKVFGGVMYCTVSVQSVVAESELEVFGAGRWNFVARGGTDSGRFLANSKGTVAGRRLGTGNYRVKAVFTITVLPHQLVLAAPSFWNNPFEFIAGFRVSQRQTFYAYYDFEIGPDGNFTPSWEPYIPAGTVT